jgi:hypothetical protein
VSFETTEPELGHMYMARAYGAPLRISGSHENYLLRHVRSGPGSFYIDTGT